MGIRSFYMAFFTRKTRHHTQVRLFCRLASVSVILLTLTSVSHANNYPKQDLKKLEETVTHFLESYYSNVDVSQIEVNVGKLDPRLALAACDDNLSMEFNDTSNSGGNITVQTRCEGPQNWSIYVPAQVGLFRPIAVANRTLNRGDVITHNDIGIENINISQLRQGYLESAETIVGQELRRPISKGEAFRSNILDAPMVIKRGDEVSIEMQAGSITVTSSGTAMGNGRIGQRIRIRNSQSERMLSAEVVGAGRVKTAI